MTHNDNCIVHFALKANYIFWNDTFVPDTIIKFMLVYPIINQYVFIYQHHDLLSFLLFARQKLFFIIQYFRE